MSKSLLLIPGPVPVADTVLAAMARPMIDHRGPVFKSVLERISARLKPIFGTSSDVLILGGSGTGGLEAAVSSLFSPGDRVLSCPIGVFGARLADIARRWGLEVEILETPWGEALDPARLAARLREDTGERRFKGVLLTHNETSTGVQNRMDELATAIGDHPASVVVDAVSGLAASPFAMDAWRFDVVVTASQKALAVPPGLAMVAVSSRAWERMEQAKGPSYYFDLRKARDFATLGQTPWTPPVSVAFALDVALAEYEAIGAEAAWRRHAQYAEAIRAAIGAIGLTPFSHERGHSPTVVAIRVPEGIEAAAVQRRMREEYGVVISGGQKELKGKIFRIGTMGAVSPADLIGALGVFELALAQEGYRPGIGGGVTAALQTLQYSPAVAAATAA